MAKDSGKSLVGFRAESAFKDELKRAAKAQDLTLGQWIRGACRTRLVKERRRKASHVDGPTAGQAG